jgi:hypothetical protein
VPWTEHIYQPVCLSIWEGFAHDSYVLQEALLHQQVGCIFLTHVVYQKNTISNIVALNLILMCGHHVDVCIMCSSIKNICFLFNVNNMLV